MKARFVLIPLVAVFLTMGGDCRNLNNLNPCLVAATVEDVPIAQIDSVDMVFIMDDSLSMKEEQTELADKVSRVVELLVDGAGTDSDPTMEIPDFPAVKSLRVGVFSSSLGADPQGPGAEGPCNEEWQDRGAQLLVEGVLRPSQAVCELYPGLDPVPANYTQFPEIVVDQLGEDQAYFNDGVECILGQGTDTMFGCGYERQLEGVIKGLGVDGPDFETCIANNNCGPNAGFLRNDALLVIVLVSDEDDCSAEDTNVWDIEDAEFPGALPGPYVESGPQTGAVKINLRCWAHQEHLWDVQRYVERVAKLKNSPSQIVFAAITGVPNDDPELDLTDYDAILAHPLMVQVPNPGDEQDSLQQLRPSCISELLGGAGSAESVPPVRIVQTAKGLQDEGVETIVQSICEDNYTPLLDNIVDKIGSALRRICLPRPQIRGSDGKVGCQVTETQPKGTKCETVQKGRTFLRLDENDPEREVCLVEQLPVLDNPPTEPAGEGWYYDDFSDQTDICTAESKQRVTFADGSGPSPGVSVRFECLQGIIPAEPDIGYQCIFGVADQCPVAARSISLQEQYGITGEVNLACQQSTNTCQITCDNDAACPGGYVCYDPKDVDPESPDEKFCLNPTCTFNTI